MDALKLLRRGTSLEKTRRPHRAIPEHHIPSEGAPVRPQVLSEHHEDTSNHTKNYDRGIKRKRNYKSGSDPQKPEKPVSKAIYQHKPNEDCKRIQKLHKLKVSVLNDLGNHSNPASRGQKHLTQLISQPLESFQDLGPWFHISRRLAENITSQGYVIPTEVQLGSIPLLLGSDDDRGVAGLKRESQKESAHVDLVTVAPTGSGKTLAFLIPLIQGLLDDRGTRKGDAAGSSLKRCVNALILAPTHELVEQTVREARKLLVGTGLHVSAMRKGTKVFQHSRSGEDIQEESEALVKSQILVSTPLVLLHSLSGDSKDAQELPSVTNLVLDEADVLLDPLFREQTIAIWRACTNPLLHISLWSATIGSSVESLTQRTITERRKRLGLSTENHFILRLIVGLKDSALPTIAHRMIYTATEQGKLLAMRQMLHPSTADASDGAPSLRPPFLVFTQTIQRASALHSELLYDIQPEAGGSSRIAVLHSRLSDTARSDTMARFRKAEIWVLITTDLLARGVDFRGVNGVVSFDIPTTSAAYVHRAGRTGRAGREGGIAVTLYTKEDIPYVRNIANVIAASQKQSGKRNGESELPKWLIDALPTVSKKKKQELKQRGVAMRRPNAEVDDKQARRARISTKSGYDRRLQNRRMATTGKGSRSQAAGSNEEEANSSADTEWAGFGD